MTDIQTKIRTRVDSLVEDITALVQQSLLEATTNALRDELRSIRGAGGGTRRSGGVAEAAPARVAATKSRASRRPGAKRAANEIAAISTRIQTYIAQNPGVGIEKIGKDLQTATSDLVLPVKKLLASNVIRREGEKRATKYYPGGGGGGAARRGRKAKRG